MIFYQDDSGMPVALAFFLIFILLAGCAAAVILTILDERKKERKRADERAEEKRESQRRSEIMRDLFNRCAANAEEVKQLEKARVRKGSRKMICASCMTPQSTLCRIAGSPMGVFAGALGGPAICYTCKPAFAYEVSILG